MRSVGYQVDIFGSAEEFLASQAVPAPDCLILDVYLPGKTGLELQQELAARGVRIPIIFMSAHRDEQLRDRAMENGAYAFLGKPVQGKSVLDGIRAAIGA